ncbi:hypothetical protein PIB30_087073 [Stylosanthes scabra]|uniref:Transposase MuDR plant domain-containing protein n=1 Tax=Stylosanthes scabra TaxID=79078 RepID=A0ABU6TST3_9FABA|nr:hypothetical protein [Stylosanthes scabra]
MGKGLCMALKLYKLRRLGYPRPKIESLWYKDPTLLLTDENLFSFTTDDDSNEMYQIVELRNYIEMYVEHEIDKYEEPFSECGYIDVGDDPKGCGPKGGDNSDKEHVNDGVDTDNADGEGLDGDSGGLGADGVADGVGLDGDNANGVDADNANGGGTEVDSEDDSNDEEFVPSEGDINSADDIYFTDSEDNYDDDSGFVEENGKEDVSRVEKGKGVANDGLSDEGGCYSNEQEDVYRAEVGDGDGDGYDVGVYGNVFSVYKPKKYMKEYRWQLGNVFACREEFKDAVVLYAEQNVRGVTFKKCDLCRVRARCQDGRPFWLYGVKMPGESTWQLRSMNMKHTCGQTKRVGILLQMVKKDI